MQVTDARQLDAFFDATVARPTLGLMYGRRRIGKSTALVERTYARDGFYFEAIRVETSVQLDRLARALTEHLNLPGRLAFADWEEAIGALLSLGDDRPIPVVLDEIGHIIEADTSFESVLASAFGPGAQPGRRSRVRMVLCGSAISMMRALTAGQAPLRGRAGMELIVHADDYREAAQRLPGTCDLVTATRVFAVIGGVVGYATDMVGFDLPTSAHDFDRWVTDRVLVQGATLHSEATTLLGEDPTFAGRGSLLYNSILGAIANGAITAGAIAKLLAKQVANIAPGLNRLVDAGFVVRHEDPIRRQRPVYELVDPFLQFHYAVLEPHGALLRDRDPRDSWDSRLKEVFNAQVRGPVFEEQARTWVRRFADSSTLGVREYVGPSSVNVDRTVRQVDIIAAATGEEPSERVITAIGEAKSGEALTTAHLHRLERIRAALGERATGSKLLLFGASIDSPLRHESEGRGDVELINLERLYFGS
ncbi:MAG: AAA family ATPase [Acidimicrobiales bacterium]